MFFLDKFEEVINLSKIYPKIMGVGLLLRLEGGLMD